MPSGKEDELLLATHADGVALSVRVVPGASRTRIVGILGGALKVAVAAPPEGGKANDAVIRLLAAAVGVRRADVVLLSGPTRRQKRLCIVGKTVDQVRIALADPS